VDATTIRDNPAADKPSPRLSALFGRRIYVWIGLALVVSLSPRLLFFGWTKHQFEPNSVGELVPRAVLAVAVAAFLWSRRAKAARRFLPAANAAIVLSLTWLLVGPHLPHVPLWGTAFNTAWGLLCTLSIYRWTTRRLAA